METKTTNETQLLKLFRELDKENQAMTLRIVKNFLAEQDEKGKEKKLNAKGFKLVK